MPQWKLTRVLKAYHLLRGAVDVKIGVIDYGMGNLFSVEQALKRLGCEVIITADEKALDTADALLLPGVGGIP